MASIADIVCPVCGKGHLLKGSTAYGCSEYKNGCSLRLPFDEYPATISPEELRDMIKAKYSVK